MNTEVRLHFDKTLRAVSDLNSEGIVAAVEALVKGLLPFAASGRDISGVSVTVSAEVEPDRPTCSLINVALGNTVAVTDPSGFIDKLNALVINALSAVGLIDAQSDSSVEVDPSHEAAKDRAVLEALFLLENAATPMSISVAGGGEFSFRQEAWKFGDRGADPTLTLPHGEIPATIQIDDDPGMVISSLAFGIDQELVRFGRVTISSGDVPEFKAAVIWRSQLKEALNQDPMQVLGRFSSTLNFGLQENTSVTRSARLASGVFIVDKRIISE